METILEYSQPMNIHVDLHVHLAGLDDISFMKLTLAKLLTQGDHIMSAFSDFAAKQKTYNEAVNGALQGISDDIVELNKKIQALQDSQGQVTPEDQVLLDELQAQGEALAAKAKALDDLNPPVAPVAAPDAPQE